MNALQNTLFILRILFVVFGSLFLLDRYDQSLREQTPGTRLVNSVAWLAVCDTNLSEPAGVF